MAHSNSDLNESFVKVTLAPGRFVPNILPKLVGFKEVAAVEKLDADEESGMIHRIARGLLGKCDRCAHAQFGSSV